MTFDPQTAAIRFGTGLSPRIDPTTSVDQMLDTLRRPDDMARKFPVDRFADIQFTIDEIRRLNRTRRENKDSPIAKEAKQRIRLLKKSARRWQASWLNAALSRGAMTQDGFRERLVQFWGDHFTVVGKVSILRYTVSTYVEDAIRPHLSGTFADLLKAAVFHPMMLIYLDQVNSVGPNSRRAARRKGTGLNENLAREVLELHTLGVGANYTQSDVRSFAKLLAGVTYRGNESHEFAGFSAEPGPIKILGKSYRRGVAQLRDVEQFLEDLALHPDTAKHLARKLAVHFVSDAPDQGLVNAIAKTYLASGGDLTATYRAMLNHPAAWAMPDQKVKQPFDFIVSSLRALDVTPADMKRLNWKVMRAGIYAPLALMGQKWQSPTGPDGWPEAAGDWITPQALAARIQWAMTVPAIVKPDLPDPRKLVQTALAGRASGALAFAAKGAENRAEGVGIILAAPEFQRR